MPLFAFRVTAVLVVLGLGFGSAADDVYLKRLNQLTITQGSLPKGSTDDANSWSLPPQPAPYVVLDGPGEAFVTTEEAEEPMGWMPRWSTGTARIAARLPAGAATTGTLFFPGADGRELAVLRFSLNAPADEEDAQKRFERAKFAHYERLRMKGGAGTAFFRYLADTAGQAAGEDPWPRDTWRNQRPEMTDTYDLFSGGTAVSENLQLYRDIGTNPADPADPAEKLVDVASVQGITVPEFDWSGRLGDQAPVLDPLASAIPADQHAAFFPSFAALSTLLDEVAENGLPALRGLRPRSEDSRLVDRYERQLCLPRTALSRLLGPSLIKSIAITGGDPYFDTGTDVAILFQSTNPTALAAALHAQIVALKPAGTELTRSESANLTSEGVQTADRAISAHIAVLGDIVVVSNSTRQLARLASVPSGQTASISSLPEYRYFRARYPIGAAGETAFVFLSDATIRRWCGPQWRIGASRRLRASAILADATSAHVKEIAIGTADGREIQPPMPMRTIGTVQMQPWGITSSVYGHGGFLTPILELDISQVPQDEVNTYAAWRRGYERNWRWAFDPIAISFGIAPGDVSADLSVVPLIVGSEYRTWISAAMGAAIAPGAGDPHDAFAHAVFAINIDSVAAQQASGMARTFGGLKVDPLGWLGQSVAIFADPDPYWAELAAADDPTRFIERQSHRMPIGLYAQVGSAIKLTAFLAGLRAWIEESSPGMMAWETRTHNDRPYVRGALSEATLAAGGDEAMDHLEVFYAPMPTALIVSINEGVLTRAMDREAARIAAKGAPDTAPAWLGKSMDLRFTREGLDIVQSVGRQAFRTGMQERSWSNLPILNEWKRQFPKADPVAVHQKLFGTRPVCPGGGEYIWNDKYKTMESTAYGHPGEPKAGPDLPNVLSRVESGDLGLTFEDQGLRAKTIIKRTPR